jgi:hypothetical protein
VVVVDWCGQAEQQTAAVSMQLEVLLMIEQSHRNMNSISKYMCQFCNVEGLHTNVAQFAASHCGQSA